MLANKIDTLSPEQRVALPSSFLPVSAVTGEGIPAFIAAVVARVVPHPPSPGEAVPFTAELAHLIERASAALATGASDTARQLLLACLPSA